MDILEFPIPVVDVDGTTWIYKVNLDPWKNMKICMDSQDVFGD